MMPESNLIIPETRIERMPVPVSEAAVLLQVISRAAADKDIDLDRVERLLLMHEKITAKQAEKAFIEAMAKFKETAPRIMKAKLVSFPTQDGGTTSYRHATLGAVCQAAVAGLGAVGISHRWDLSTADGKITVTCVLTHTGGHSTKTVLAGAADASGKKNAIQQVASTITYLERYTLLAATGLATEDQDDDGVGGDSDLDEPTIGPGQIAMLEQLSSEVQADIPRLCRMLKVDTLADIRVGAFDTVKSIIEAKRVK
jgi:ERF superfamily